MAVIGDGAVGLCATLAARRLGAARIIVLGHQAQRLTLARQFGATDVVTSRGEQAVLQVIEMTGGGAGAVLECVGTEEAINQAVNMTRPGGTVGFVGGPTWQRTDPVGAHVFLQYRLAWRAGSGARLSSRTACRGACRSA